MYVNLDTNFMSRVQICDFLLGPKVPFVSSTLVYVEETKLKILLTVFTYFEKAFGLHIQF